jgi:division protein CdvB (Snf7/Vps24/ESCRT-III family)
MPLDAQLFWPQRVAEGTKIKNQKSKIKNQKSKIKNQKSKIKKQKSKIKNQKTKIKNRSTKTRNTARKPGQRGQGSGANPGAINKGNEIRAVFASIHFRITLVTFRPVHPVLR